MIALLAIPAGILLGFGVSAQLAYSDTRRGIHPRSMGGPKLQKPLLRKYRLLAMLMGLAGWVAVVAISDSWPTYALGMLGGVIGGVMFSILDRRMTRHMG